ncbi:MAG: ABC transporter ATP-binding protein/permease [Oculatellaceae cyanobacterium Prado106]|jgi:ATP-binding cassette subfamily B protein|nr:ABC transporter ATP-binding protein/permease [Oculatellaceae cyanobacterium Prado106]
MLFPRIFANFWSTKILSKIQHPLAQFSYLPKTFQLIWAASQRWTIAWILLLIVQGLLPGATVYLTRTLVDQLLVTAGIGVSWQSIQIILVPVALMAAVIILSEVVQGMSEWVRTAQSELVQDYISGLVHQQSARIDYGCYESSDDQDRLEQAREGATTRPLALLENMGSLLQNGITLLAMAAILLPYGYWLPILLCVSALPAFYITLQHNLRQYQWSQRTTMDRRRLHYYDVLLTSGWVAAELRLFNYGTFFQAAYQRIRQRLRHDTMNLLRAQTLSRLLAGAIALLIAAAALAWMGRQVLLGLLTLGDLALFYQAFNRGQSIIKSLLGNFGQIYKNSLFIGNLFEFLNLQPELVDPPHPHPIPAALQTGIRFRQVTFRYPGSPEAVLESFNLMIPAGKIVAIVGDNGAGKSTLIKLLCRFYDPQSGAIELDDMDLRSFAVADLRRMITVLFQNPMPYYVSAAENLALGDIAANPSPVDREQAARNAGIHDKIMSLSQGYETLLGKWFPGGTELSGGQWQRLALARAFLRKANLMILDEPTSAMDPWAEFDWLERFRSLAEGKTAIVITHRFTLAMRADLIFVMRDGKVVESGHHDELVAQGGFYAESWNTQMHSPVASSETEPRVPLPQVTAQN